MEPYLLGVIFRHNWSVFGVLVCVCSDVYSCKMLLLYYFF